MEELIKRQSFTPSSANSTKLAMHKDSHVISKFKPKIRIIHVFAPEIIKTDAANFRELVQNLTGNKPYADKINGGMMRSKTTGGTSAPSKKMEEQKKDEFTRLQNRELIKEEIEELWRGEKINSFLDGFSDVDGFIEELNQFHSLPLRSSLMDVFEDPKVIM